MRVASLEGNFSTFSTITVVATLLEGLLSWVYDSRILNELNLPIERDVETERSFSAKN
jgi:hypothetical protein